MNDQDADPIDDLYRGDPSDFVARRKSLAVSLKADGDPELAALVAKLRKPPRTASALSEFATAAPETVSSLLEAARAVGASLRSGGVELRAAQSAYTAIVGEVVDGAAEQGGVASDSMRERMRSTVLAAGADPDGEIARQLSVGAVRDDAEAPGFAFGIVGPLPDSPSDGSSDAIEESSESESSSRPRRRLRSVSSSTRARKATDDTAAPPQTDPEPEPDEEQRLDDALRERERLAAERAEAEREATARREAMRRRRTLERELARLERRAERMVEQADEAEAKAALARTSADDAVAELEAVRDRIAELDI